MSDTHASTEARKHTHTETQDQQFKFKPVNTNKEACTHEHAWKYKHGGKK